MLLGSFKKFIALLGLLVIVQAFLLACGDNPTSTVVPAATIAATTAPTPTTTPSAPTSTPVPTATVVPTATPIPATQAPSPTPIPATATSTPLPPSPTPLPPSPTPQPPTATPAPAFNSKGIGLDKATWEAMHGSGSGSYIYSYEDKKYLVMFTEEKVWNLSREYGKAPVTKAAMQAEARALMPPDAKLVKTFTVPASGASAELYMSQTLKTRFTSNLAWTGGEPGNFIVIYKSAEFIMATGNNP